MISSWTTDSSLLKWSNAPLSVEVDDQPGPSRKSSKKRSIPDFAVLARLSPSKNVVEPAVKQKKAAMCEANICRVCGIKYKTKKDIETESPWMGCSFEIETKKEKRQCDYWVHCHCKGFPDMTCEEAKQINFFCELHNPKKHGTRITNNCRGK